MCVIHDRKSSNVHLNSGEGDRGPKGSMSEWVADKRWTAEREGSQDRANDQRCVDKERQSDEEINNWRESDHMQWVVLLH